MRTLEIRIFGIVQGVGFRPFVDRLAHECGIRGSVANRGSFVEVFAQGGQQELAAFGLVLVRDRLLRIVERLGDELALEVVEPLDIGAELQELVVALGLLDRTGNDERGTGVVDEDGVNLIHDGVVMLPLDEV